MLAHFTVYLVLDRGLILGSIAGDILKRPYIMLGMAGLLMLIPAGAHLQPLVDPHAGQPLEHAA